MTTIGQVRIERAEVERFKRTHTNLFKRLYDCRNTKKWK